ncbi:cytochrome P450 [Saccharothrix obliqua]|uniref:cytochrome P450 n=1 Tax=Saccharothrix obliqua TaxID=2861747 RepID=UPI001C5F9457|nr:cytochrome P450 [Saccharothrix obliqua]MBW4722364.1 cytochrome P450 [Saccharothrix obliqua]
MNATTYQVGPLVRVTLPHGGDAWLATTHRDVRAVLSDRRFSRAAAVGTAAPRVTPVDHQGGSLLGLDPPDHTRLRRLAAGAFTARRVAAHRADVEAAVTALLDDMVAAGPPADLVAALAWPLPIAVICRVLGVPVEDQDLFRGWAGRLVALTADDPATITGARGSLDAYLADLVAQRRIRPADDLVSVLAHAGDRGDRLTEEELIAFIVTLLIAGYETTADHIGNFTLALLSERERWDELAADPHLVPAAVEELLRHTPLEAEVGFFTRVATEDVVLDGGVVRAGEAVIPRLAAANRDAAVFDHPDRLDFTRAVNPHVGFGYGAHHCIGAPLARLELRAVFTALVRRLPGLRLAVPADSVELLPNRTMRGLRSLPVGW